MTEEQRKARLAEMAGNASVHEEARWVRQKRAREADAAEDEANAAQPTGLCFACCARSYCPHALSNLLQRSPQVCAWRAVLDDTAQCTAEQLIRSAAHMFALHAVLDITLPHAGKLLPCSRLPCPIS
jgi:hypothetical protein